MQNKNEESYCSVTKLIKYLFSVPITVFLINDYSGNYEVGQVLLMFHLTNKA